MDYRLSLMLKCKGVALLLIRSFVLGNEASAKRKRYTILKIVKYSQYLWKHRKYTSKAIGDRLDLGSILLSPTEKDMEDIRAAGYAAKWGVEPNIKLSIYKNRRGKYTNCYIWMYADKGTCRFIPLGATTWDLRPLDIAPLNITAYGRGGEKE